MPRSMADFATQNYPSYVQDSYDVGLPSAEPSIYLGW